MADLINRDHAAQAIEAYLCSQCDYDTDRDSECIACPHLDGGEILKSVPAVNRWIPCNERMPEENVYVIAWAKRKHHSRAIMAILINGIWKIGVNDCSDGFHVQGEITHWMPLPEPPEEGEENAWH